MKKNNKKGFTLVELVIVVAVMAILVAVAIPTVASITNSAQDSVDGSNARTIESIIKLREAELSNSGTALTISEVEDAIEDAKLGIDAGKVYYYDTTAGTCSVTGTESSTVYKISFAASNAVTVTNGSGTSSEASSDSSSEG